MFLAEWWGHQSSFGEGQEFCLSRGVCVWGAWEWSAHCGGSWLSGLGPLEKRWAR